LRKFSFRPVLTIKGRTFKGLRGWAGKPLHPPLTDIPVAAYLFVGAFDLLSFLTRNRESDLPTEFYRAATWVLLGGAAFSLLAALTGWADWHRSSTPGTQARRTVNAHAVLMIGTTLMVLTNLALRLGPGDGDAKVPAVCLLLSLAAVVSVTLGSTYGGSLVFDYGFNVETSGDHPVWHESETDVFPGEKH